MIREHFEFFAIRCIRIDMLKIRFIAVLVLFLVASNCVFAAEENLQEVLDRRDRFSKHLQSEVNINGGDFLGDETHNSWNVGAKYYLHINDTFAIGASYAYTPIITDWSSTFGKSLKTKQQHIIDGEVMIANDTVFRAGKNIIECDMYLTVGAGTILINRHYEPMGVIGGGIKIYTGWPWLAIRIDVNTYLHPTPNPTGDTFNGDISMNGGVSFLFPVKPIEQSSTL